MGTGDTVQSRLKRFVKRRSVKILGGLVLLAVAARLALPFGIKAYLERWLVKNGAESATIERVRFAPFAGVAALEGVAVTMDGATVFSDSTIFVNLGMASLLGKTALLEEATLADLVLDVEHKEDGSLRVASYTITPKGAEAEGGEMVTEEKAPSAWIFIAQKIALSNVTIHYRMPGLDANLLISEARIEKLNSSPDNYEGSLRLKGELNGASIELDIPRLGVAPHLALEGTVAIGDFSLEDLGGVLQGVLAPFRGTAALDGAVAFAMRDAQDLDVTWDGNIRLANGDIGGENWAVGGTISYDGHAAFAMEQQGMQVEVDGDLRAIAARFDMPEPLIDIDNPDILISGKTNVKIGDGVQLETSAGLTLAPTTYVAEQFKTGAGDTTWAGTVVIDTGTEDRALTLEVNGDLTAAAPFFDLSQERGLMHVGNDRISWQGRVEYGLEKGEKSGQYVRTDGTMQGDGTFYILPDVVDIAPSDVKLTGKTEVLIGKDLQVHHDGDLGLGALEMGLPGMRVGNNALSWSGKVAYGLEQGEQTSQRVETEGTLKGEQVVYSLADTIEFSQGSLDLTGKSEVRIGGEFGVSYEGDLNLAATALAVAGMTIDEERLAWSGGVQYDLGESGQTIGLDGTLGLTGTDFGMVEQALKVRQESLQVTPAFTLKLGEKMAFEGKAGLDGNGLQVRREEVVLAQLERLFIDNLRGDGSGGVMADGLVVEQVNVPSSDTIPVAVVLPSLSLSELHSPDLLSGKAAHLSVSHPVVKDKEDGMVLAELDELLARDIAVDREVTAAIGQLALSGGRFLMDTGEEPRATMKKLALNTLSYSKSDGLFCDAVVLDSIKGQLVREKTVKKKEEKKVQAGKEEKEQQEPAPIPLKINTIDVVGDNQVQLTDATLTQTFMTMLTLESLTVRDIDLNHPEKPFTYEVRANFDKYTPLVISGSAAPLAKKLFVKQKLGLKNFSMLHGSPYTVEAIGTYFPSGMADLSSLLDIGDGRIDMKNNLVFKELKAEKIEGDLASELDNNIPVPLGLAITMLEDRNGLIDLDVPIKGKLSDIKIGMSDLIWTPLSNAITIAVTPYLAYTALGPAGALTYLGAKIGGNMLNANMPVLKFTKGQRELTTEHLTALDKAGKMITDELARDGEQTWTICAKVSLSELHSVSGDKAKNQEVFRNEAIRKELHGLGEARSQAVQEYLVQQFGIGKDRLLICNPGLEFNEGANPVVEFMK